MKITKIDYTSPSMNDVEYADVFVYEGSKRIMRIRVNKDGSTNKEYFINDYQGSPVVVVAEDESIKYQNYQDPWGNMEMSIGVPTSNPEFTYTDKELDEDSGLYYFQARYMDPLTGRFMGRDHAYLENNRTRYFQINPFHFCKNNPVRNIDPDGNLDLPNNVDGGVLGSRGFTQTPVLNPATGALKKHPGQDIPAVRGTLIRARADGVVTKIGTQRDANGKVVGYGNYIDIKTKDGPKTRDAHIADVVVNLDGQEVRVPQVFVTEGQEVKEGDVIAVVGSTGDSTGPHDHSEVLKYDPKLKTEVRVNPLDSANKVGRYSSMLELRRDQLYQSQVSGIVAPNANVR